MLTTLEQGQYFGSEIKSLDFDFFQVHINGYHACQKVCSHHHENPYLSLLVNGAYVEQCKRAEDVIDKGDLIFRPSYHEHADSFSTRGGVCFNLEFKKNWQELVDVGFDLPDASGIYKAGTLPAVYKLLSYLLHHMDRDLCREAAINCIFELGKEGKIKSSLPWLEKVVAILDHELDSYHTIQSLSDRVFVHPIYLARAFKTKTGFTIGEYQTMVKLSSTCSLLLNSNFSVQQIASLSGFCDAAHLVNAFKCFFKSTPHQFRLRARKLISFSL